MTVGLFGITNKPTAQAPELATVGTCERDGATFVGSTPRALQDGQRPPKKLHDVRPAFPQIPLSTTGNRKWIGEVLLGTDGKVSHTWTIRPIRFPTRSPEFNRAVLTAVQQWEFEPFVLNSKPTPLCMLISVEVPRR